MGEGARGRGAEAEWPSCVGTNGSGVSGMGMTRLFERARMNFTSLSGTVYIGNLQRHWSLTAAAT